MDEEEEATAASRETMGTALRREREDEQT